MQQINSLFNWSALAKANESSSVRLSISLPEMNAMSSAGGYKKHPSYKWHELHFNHSFLCAKSGPHRFSVSFSSSPTCAHRYPF